MKKRMSWLLLIAAVWTFSICGSAFAAPEADGVASGPAPFREIAGMKNAVGTSLSGTPATTAASGQVSTSGSVSASAVPLFVSDFEGPGTWWVTGAPANWGLTGYRKSNGAMSMYCAQAGRPAPGPYLNNTETWMIAGPFNLTGYSAAVLNFDVWMVCEQDDYYVTDYLFAGVSSDGANYGGMAWDGNSNGWQNVSIDVSSYCGQPSVYVGFEFSSDESIAYEGAYIDHASLWVEPIVVNYAPVAAGDSYTATAGKSKWVEAPGVLGNDSDANGDTLSASVVGSPAHGTLILNGSGSFLYTPSAGYTGPDSFTYKDWDGKAYSNIATVSITIGADVAPVAANDSYVAVKNSPKQVAAPGVLANDSDPNGDQIRARNASDPAHGTVSLNLDGSFVYTPDAGYVGTDTFTYQAYDEALYSVAGTVTMNVVESPPINVYRFYNWRAGTHFYTADETEKANVMANLAGTYTFEGVGYTLQPANNDAPLYRFFKPSTGTHFYTADPGEKNRVQTTLGHVFSFEGSGYSVSSSDAGGTKPAVYRFYRPSTGTHFYSADRAEVDNVMFNPALRGIYSYDGPAFYLGQ